METMCVLLMVLDGKTEFLRVPETDAIAMVSRAECNVQKDQREKIAALALENPDDFPDEPKVASYKCLCE